MEGRREIRRSKQREGEEREKMTEGNEVKRRRKKGRGKEISKREEERDEGMAGRKERGK